jgi:hypothetical protein
MLNTPEKSPTKESHVAPAHEARDNVDAEVTEVTPQLAAEWLALNKDNRTYSKDVVKKYASDMKAGAWKFTGDPVRFDIEGVLIDGQHRLMACIDAETSFTTLVIRGLPNKTKEVLDIGRKRNLGAVLHSLGYKFSPKVSQAALALLQIKGQGITTSRNRISTHAVVDIVERHPGLSDSVDFVQGGKGTAHGKLPSGFGQMAGALAAIHYIATHILGKGEAADRFIEVFRTGIPSYEGDVAHVLRESIIKERMKNRVLLESYRLGSLCQAWNYFEQGLPLHKFRRVKEAIIDGLDTEKI